MVRKITAVTAFVFFALMMGPQESRGQAAPTPAATPTGQSANLAKLQDEAVEWLQGLIRINTTNPPGNELAAAKYLADILQREGIHADVIETAPGRGFLVARLSSSAVPDPSRALLLMGHLDEVGVDKGKWTVDPFGGVIKDGYLYGRGAIDDKGMVAVNLAAFIALKRAGVRLNRDVIFFTEGDEEAGGENGMAVAVAKYWDRIAAGFAINEGGYPVLNNDLKNPKLQYIGVQVSEKVPVNVAVTAKGMSGHGSIPRKDNAVVHLSAAVAKIGMYEAPVQLNSVTRQYFQGLSLLVDEETGKWMRALETPDRGEHAARWLSDANPFWNSMLRDTIAPTMLQAGIRNNVVPAVAHANLNIRLLPGDTIDPLLGKLQQLVNDPQVIFEVDLPMSETAPSSSLTSDLYTTIERVAAKDFPGTKVLPYMSTVATDVPPLRMRTVQAYGLLPFPLTEGDYLRMHAEDERIPIDSFRKGVAFLCDIVTEFAVSK